MARPDCVAQPSQSAVTRAAARATNGCRGDRQREMDMRRDDGRTIRRRCSSPPASWPCRHRSRLRRGCLRRPGARARDQGHRRRHSGIRVPRVVVCGGGLRDRRPPASSSRRRSATSRTCAEPSANPGHAERRLRGRRGDRDALRLRDGIRAAGRAGARDLLGRDVARDSGARPRAPTSWPSRRMTSSVACSPSRSRTRPERSSRPTSRARPSRRGGRAREPLARPRLCSRGARRSPSAPATSRAATPTPPRGT